MFSSSSLSKTMVLHLGHLVHSPSGISRFLDFAPNLGFLTKVVLPVGGGGVTAGSDDVSKPSVFFVNAVVLIKLIIGNIQVPLATVQTQTSLAPASFNVRAHELVVAPVVKTSSTSTIRSPFNLRSPIIANALRMFL